MQHREARPGSVVTVLAAAVLCALLFVHAGSSPAAVAATAPGNHCSVQQAALDAVQERINAHNAEPNVFELPRQAAQAAAYDARAARLNAEQEAAIAQLEACLAAIDALEGPGRNGPALPAPTERTLTAIETALKQVPAGWEPPPPPTDGKKWQVPADSPVRPLYDALRRNNPGNLGATNLQGTRRPSTGASDPAYPGRTIGANRQGGPAVSPDHIIPLAELLHLPGFLDLTPENMYLVVHAPLNLQWLSYPANWSKSSRSVASMSGVDPRWQAKQIELENQVRDELREVIDLLLESQE